MKGAIERAWPNESSQQNALQIAQHNANDLNFKSFITLWKLAIGPARKILEISYSLRTLYDNTKINRFGNLQLDTVPC